MHLIEKGANAGRCVVSWVNGGAGHVTMFAVKAPTKPLPWAMGLFKPIIKSSIKAYNYVSNTFSNINTNVKAEAHREGKSLLEKLCRNYYTRIR